MPTTHATFRLLSFEQQLPLVWVEGTFVARRWEEEDAVALYHMDGSFFCEVFLEQDHYSVVRVESFTGAEGLEPYTLYIDVDEVKRLLG